MAQLDFPFPIIPAGGHVTLVAPGLWWLRMPLPFKLDHINLWLVEETDGWTVIDTGLATDATKALWGQIFETALDGKPIRRVIVTHFHPDHMGLAGWLTERWGVECWATLGEWLFGRMLCLDDTDAFVEMQVEFYRRCGFTDDMLAVARERRNIYAGRVSPVPPQFRRMQGGETVTIGGHDWVVITGAGHCPEHASLFCPALNVLISGDQVLPRISPNVSVWPQEPDADPLGQFLASLDDFRDLPFDVLVLPSHGLPFRGLQARLDELAHHHDQRLAETLALCAQPVTGVDLLKALFQRELDSHQLFFAIGESLAHVHYLMAEGRIRRDCRADGVWLYRQA